MPIFVMHIYRDEAPAKLLLRRIRHLYPEAAIAVIMDGPAPSGDLERLAEEMGLHLHRGERLKLPQFGGAWLERMFRIALELPGDYVIRIDPDSWLWRCFRHFPEADVFGTVIGFLPQQINMVRGGCIGWSKAAIARILDSGVLRDPCYLNRNYYAYWSNGELLSSACYIAGHVIKRLGLNFEDWSEVRVCAEDPTIATLTRRSRPRWAATHPHKGESWDTE